MMNVTFMWPGKKAIEAASVYIAIGGDSWTEGIAITIEKSPLENFCIGEIIWGRR
jgi:hypothetical protein